MSWVARSGAKWLPIVDSWAAAHLSYPAGTTLLQVWSNEKTEVLVLVLDGMVIERRDGKELAEPIRLSDIVGSALAERVLASQRGLER